MTAYFDDLRTRVREASERAGREPGSTKKFLAELAEIENEVADTVSLCVGDREFPDNFRQKALAIIVTKSVAKRHDLEPLELAADMAAALRSSDMCESLHSLFHRVASDRIQTRFGLLSDSPAGNLARRDAFDRELGEKRAAFDRELGEKFPCEHMLNLISNLSPIEIRVEGTATVRCFRCDTEQEATSSISSDGIQ